MFQQDLAALGINVSADQVVSQCLYISLSTKSRELVIFAIEPLANIIDARSFSMSLCITEAKG